MADYLILSAVSIGVLALIIVAVSRQLMSTVEDPKWLFMLALLRIIQGRPAYRRRRRTHGHRR